MEREGKEYNKENIVVTTRFRKFLGDAHWKPLWVKVFTAGRGKGPPRAERKEL